jgi:hypothetical protein
MISGGLADSTTAGLGEGMKAWIEAFRKRNSAALALDDRDTRAAGHGGEQCATENHDAGRRRIYTRVHDGAFERAWPRRMADPSSFQPPGAKTATKK